MTDEGRQRGAVPASGALKATLVGFGTALLPLPISWRWGWWEALVYAAAIILGFVATRGLAGLKQPGLPPERFRLTDHANAAAWNKVLAPMVALGSVVLPLAAGLEARFGRLFEFGRLLNRVTLGVIVAGYGIGGYALVVNRFFSGVVRIQSECGHKV